MELVAERKGDTAHLPTRALKGGVLCLAQVEVLKTLARLVLVLSVTGAVPQPLAHAAGADAGSLRATQAPLTLEFIRALRPTEGMVLTRDGLRFEIAARSNHVHPGLSTTRIALPPPNLVGALVQRGLASRRFASRHSAPLRGPPDTI